MEKQTGRPAETVPHNLILEARSRLTVTGVRRVIRCDPDSAVIETADCVLEPLGGPAERHRTGPGAGRGQAVGPGGRPWNTPRPRPPGGLLRRLIR